MSEPRIITKVLVGSRLHGLDSPASDYDWRTIRVSPLQSMVSPFRSSPAVHAEQESWELGDFCKMLTKGHPRVLEVLFSDMHEQDTLTARLMRAEWKKFMDTDAYVSSAQAYAANQYQKFTTIEDVRTRKFAIAYVLTLWRLAVFLETGKFEPRVTEAPIRAVLSAAKNSYSREQMPVLTNLYIELRNRVDAAVPKAERSKPDINWIEEFILDAYTEKL